MKRLIPLLFAPAMLMADDAELAKKISRHQEGSRILSDEQDELAADVQQLTIEQTSPKVIELFEEVEEAMDEASELLYNHDTGGPTIAAETDVIEKIFEAAKAKQQQSSQQQQGEGEGEGEGEGQGQGQGQGQGAGSAMLDMLERMLGREPGQQPGQQPGEQPGQGSGGDSTTPNESIGGNAGGKVEERTVPKGAGTAGRSLPREYLDALKAYNQGAEKLNR